MSQCLFTRSLAGSGLLIAALLATTPALASTERLEAELRALFAEGGELSIGDVSSAMLRSRYTAEDIVFNSAEGERLMIGSYVVDGDYDQPERVTLQDIRVEDSLTELALLQVEEVVLNEPSRAVFPLREAMGGQDFQLGGLEIDQIVVDLDSELAEEFLRDAGVKRGRGRLDIERLYGESLSADAIGLLEINGLAATGEDLEEFGSGSLTLDSLRMEQWSGLENPEVSQLNLLVMENFAIDSDRLVGRLDELRIDGDLTDGEGGMWLEAFEVDLERMIANAPVEERTQLRMASNLLTDGSGTLKLDAAFNGRWEQHNDHSTLGGDSRITLHDAMQLAFGVNLPVVLPENTQPMDAFHDSRLLDAATLLGGDLSLTLSDMGLFSRLVTVGAALEGITEAQMLEQARTQAQGFGMMMGPEVQAVLSGFVALLEGSASELEINATLPPQSNLKTYTDDPLGLPSQLSLQVETR
ncbi:hypothetical protein VRRI112168_07210 [Vreelandella rituensis]|uniref:DUF2125 domain-containing protein n=1 Tax=Vreelandella rituensis TaxID=2282306 RepID=A0A368U567_9GAMM|nr:hypothetical protein [Halomonas rituensis]RCV92165.1 hypothetical protein DU506_09180 [Halomonas rituensis]